MWLTAPNRVIHVSLLRVTECRCVRVAGLASPPNAQLLRSVLRILWPRSATKPPSIRLPTLAQMAPLRRPVQNTSTTSATRQNVAWPPAGKLQVPRRSGSTSGHGHVQSRPLHAGEPLPLAPRQTRALRLADPRCRPPRQTRDRILRRVARSAGPPSQSPHPCYASSSLPPVLAEERVELRPKPHCVQDDRVIALEVEDADLQESPIPRRSDKHRQAFIHIRSA